MAANDSPNGIITMDGEGAGEEHENYVYEDAQRGEERQDQGGHRGVGGEECRGAGGVGFGSGIGCGQGIEGDEDDYRAPRYRHPLAPGLRPLLEQLVDALREAGFGGGAPPWLPAHHDRDTDCYN